MPMTLSQEMEADSAHEEGGGGKIKNRLRRIPIDLIQFGSVSHL